MPPLPSPACHALVKTHHITSRKKVAQLRKAAGKLGCYALLRSGGCPGIMYCRGAPDAVQEWVATVHALRYKDYQLMMRPATVESTRLGQIDHTPGLFEIGTVKGFANAMEQDGLLEWWRHGMKFA
ncbi:hypothetical protein BDY21DRAFT_289289 [Lineolata rhizophorae]|uniref:Uncharacterized protein n=1 Tax=Lineolata rhizophorae TaxID=578093 RepID=A0A6A6NWC2_9PEZI|nr:hypothetical protein BDY21DRAFT_289289 [Lineolata rhizophorae]